MSRVAELKQLVAQNERMAKAAAQTTVRAFVENNKVDLQNVVEALGVLGMSTKALETACNLRAEMVALKVPTQAELSKLQDEHVAAHRALYEVLDRLRAAGVQALEAGGGWSTRVNPLVRPAWDRERTAKFALDAAVSKVARRDELVEQIAELLGEKLEPAPAPRPQFRVEVGGEPLEDGYVRTNRPMSGQKSQRVVRGPDGAPMIQEFERKNEPEGMPNHRPASEIMRRFRDGREVPLE